MNKSLKLWLTIFWGSMIAIVWALTAVGLLVTASTIWQAGMAMLLICSFIATATIVAMKILR